MKLSDYTQGAASAVLESPAQEDLGLRVRETLHARVASERIGELAGLEPAHARDELSALAVQAMNFGGFESWTPQQWREGVEAAVDMILGLGPLEDLLNDESVTEIIVNGPKHVFFEKGGKLLPGSETFNSERELRMVVDRIVSPLGRRVDEQSPIVNARLPQGHRVNVVIPPVAMDGTALTIRKFKPKAFSLEELVEMNTMDAQLAQFLSWAVKARKNIAVSGGTGGGKTTLLNALSREIPADERIVTIEDSAELRFDEHPDIVRMEARAANTEGLGEVTIRDLVINALRMRPDRIVVGECRGAEALDMLQAMNTGHDGSLTTLHANSPSEVPQRLITMVRYGMDLPTRLVLDQIRSALDLVVQIDRMASGQRCITQVVARQENFDSEELFVPLASWNRAQQAYVWDCVPGWVGELKEAGIASAKEVEAWRCSVQCCL